MHTLTHAQMHAHTYAHSHTQSRIHAHKHNAMITDDLAQRFEGVFTVLTFWGMQVWEFAHHNHELIQVIA